MPKIVFSEPSQHGVEYLHCFMKALARQVVRYVTLHETNGTAQANDYALQAYNPVLFYSVGHGLNCIHTVECTEGYIITRGLDPCMYELRLDWFQGKVVHLLSCQTGATLGPVLIARGAGAFIGYSDDFIYGVSDEAQPLPDPCTQPIDYADVYSFADCDIEGEREMLIRNGSVRDARNAMNNKFDEYITKYITGIWKDRWIAPQASRWLEHNKTYLTVLGDTSIMPHTAQVVPSTPTPVPFFPSINCLFPRFTSTLFPRLTQSILFVRLQCFSKF